jgi:hypothetical protein
MNPRNQYLAVGIGAARLATTFTLRLTAVMLVTGNKVFYEVEGSGSTIPWGPFFFMSRPA